MRWLGCTSWSSTHSKVRSPEIILVQKLSWLYTLLIHLSLDIASDITEFAFQPKNHKRQAVGVNIFGEEDVSYDHDVWIVILRQTGVKYVLDLPGAQFGYYQPVIPYLDFEKLRVRTVVNRPTGAYFGAMKAVYLAEIDPSRPDVFGVTNSLNLSVSRGLFVTVEHWERLDPITLQKMVELPIKEYEAKKILFLRFIDRMIKMHIEDMAKRIAAIRAKAA